MSRLRNLLDPIDPQALYRQLGELIATAPDLINAGSTGVMPPNVHQWLGRCHALVEAALGGVDAMVVRMETDKLTYGNIALVKAASQKIMAALYRALAAAELEAPSTERGAFIPAGNAFDAFAAIGKIVGTVTREVFIIDPYMDSAAVTEFAPLVPAGAAVRLLADAKSAYRATLVPAVARWAQQYGQGRPLEARLAPARSLHDRVIIVDGRQAWVLTQSLKDFAARSPAAAVQADPETAALKVEAYNALWAEAVPLSSE